LNNGRIKSTSAAALLAVHNLHSKRIRPLQKVAHDDADGGWRHATVTPSQLAHAVSIPITNSRVSFLTKEDETKFEQITSCITSDRIALFDLFSAAG
jgi:hypothetical protein